MSSAWPRVPLGECFDKNEAWISLEPTAEYREVTVRLWGKGVVLRGVTTGAEVAADRRIVVRAGQFILSRIDARNGASGVVPASLDGAIVSGDFPAFEVRRERLIPEFLGWLAKTQAFVDMCRAASEGTTNRVRLKEDKFLASTIPLPPLAEQRRIVARLDALAAKIEEAKWLVQTLQAEYAILVPALYAATYDYARGLVGASERLDDLCTQITDGAHYTPTYVESGVPFLSVKDITSGVIDFEECRHIPESEHRDLKRRCNPEKDDVLLTKIGTTGVAKVVDTDREFSIFVSLALLKLDRTRLDPMFVECMLNSSRLREHAKAGTRGVGNQNLVLKFIREFPIPAPDVATQRRLVRDAQSAASRVKAVMAAAEQRSRAAEALLPSLLNRAFAGAL